jgi:signal transduction histidine kinase/CheY-like chemotaxis protein
MTSIRDDGLGSHLAKSEESLTRLQRENAALAHRADELQLVLAAGRVGYCSLDAKTRELVASTQFKAEFGLAPDARLQWQDLEERLHRADTERLAAAVTAATDQAAELDVVVRAQWSSASVQTIALRGRCIRDATGAVEKLIITSRNVSAETLAAADEKRERSAAIDHERRLRRGAESANRAKDEFLSIISHELRSPLNAILGWNRILSLKRAGDPEVSAITPRIEQSAKAQLKMVNDLLDLGRIGTGKLHIEARPVRLSKVVAGAIDLARPAAHAKGIEITADLATDPQIRADADRMQQVVVNLLSNAIKFTQRPGAITVTLRHDDGFLELAVSDSGQGIAADLLPHVFDRFRQGDMSSTRSTSGLGLGLTLVREIVNLHGGTVSASSPGPGEGATFVVRIPTSPTRSTNGHEVRGVGSTPPCRNTLTGLSVLVVDDELDARTIVAETLRLEGASVTVCDCAGAALKRLRSPDAHFDLVVTDIGMPDEDGYSLVRKLRSLDNGHHTLAIAVTGYVSKSDVDAAMDAGFDMHVPKPVDFDAFVGIVQRLTAQSARSAPRLS